MIPKGGIAKSVCKAYRVCYVGEPCADYYNRVYGGMAPDEDIREKNQQNYLLYARGGNAGSLPGNHASFCKMD